MAITRTRMAATGVVAALAVLVAVLPVGSGAAGAAAPTLAPTGLAPDATSSGGNPQLSWHPVNGAARYRVQVDDEDSFASPIANVITYNSRFSPPTLLPVGTIHWRVAALDAGSGQGPWSGVAEFAQSMAAPVAQSPANGADIDFPATATTFSWTPTPATKSYVLQIDDADTFPSPTQIVTRTTSHTPLKLDAPGQTYYWRVKSSSATNGSGVNSEWSVVRSFDLAWAWVAGGQRLRAPVPISPTPNQDVTDVAFEWKPVPGAAAYNLEADPSIEFSDPYLRATNVHTSRYSYRDSLDNAGYWWRVQAVDPEGNLGPWSEPQQFVRSWLAAPTQLLPVADAPASSGGDLRFDWTPVDHASRYELQVSANEFFSGTTATCSTVGTRTSWGGDCPNPPALLAGAFYWRVRAIDESGGPGASGSHVILGVWSPTRAHAGHAPPATVAGPFVPTATPARLAPADSLSEPWSSTPTFSWAPMPGATAYKLFIALDPNFTTVVDTYSFGRQTSFTPTEELPDNDTTSSYYWYVQPCAATCGPSPLSALPALPSSRFKKASLRIRLTSPAHGAGTEVADFPRFTWDPYLTTTSAENDDPAPGTTKLEARSYQIQASRVPTFETLIDDKVVNQPFYTPWDRTYEEGPISWRVRAIDGSGNALAWSQATVASGPSVARSLTKRSPVPVPLSPAHDATVQGAATLRWAPIDFANGYEVEVYREVDGQPSFSSVNRVLRVVTQQVNASVVQTLTPGTYRWRLRRSDADNRWGAWSTDAYASTVGGPAFTVSAAAPALLAPAAGALAAGNDLSFSWSGVSGAATYRFQRAGDATFTTGLQTTSTVMTSYAPTDQWPLGTYYWRVLALDADDQVMGTSAGRRFDKNVRPTAPAAPSVSRGDKRATLSWTPPANAGTAISGYVVTPYVGGIAQPVRLLPASPTSATVTELVNGTTYRFTIAAANSGGIGAPSPLSNPVIPAVGPSLPPGSVYVPVTPCRVVDTRAGESGFSRLAANQGRDYQIGGSSSRFQRQGGRPGGCGIPDGVTAVEASVTAVAGSGAGYLRAWPNGEAQPTATFLNYTKGQATTNTGAITLAPSVEPDLEVLNAGSAADYVIDVQGYYADAATTPTGSVYVPIAPCRVVDTRASGGALASGAQRAFRVAGSGLAAQGGAAPGCAIPEAAGAVEASVTAVAPESGGYLRAWPSGQAMPNATFLNFTRGQGTTNTGAIKVSTAASTELAVASFGGPAHYVIDVQGYFIDAATQVSPAGSVYVPITPCRVVDTRLRGGPIAPERVRSYRVAGTSSSIRDQGGRAGGCGIPEHAGAVEASVTSMAQADDGFLRAFPAGTPVPNATFLNYTKGQGTTNTGAMALSTTASADLSVKNFGGPSHYVIDVQGYFVADA